MKLVKTFSEFFNIKNASQEVKNESSDSETYLYYDEIVPGMSGLFVHGNREHAIEIVQVFKCSDLTQQQLYDIANEYEGAEYLADMEISDIKDSYIFITTAGPNSTQEHYAYVMPSYEGDILVPESEKWKQSNKLKDVSDRTGLLEN